MYDPALLLNVAQAIFFNLPSVVRGMAFSSVQYSLYSLQSEYLRGDNVNSGITIGSMQGIMANILVSALTLAFPSISALRLFMIFSWGAYLIPNIAGVTVGGYNNIKTRVNIDLDTITNERNRNFLAFIQRQFARIDYIISKIPTSLSSLVTTFLAKCHAWSGTIFLATQLAATVVIAIFQPWIGIPSLTYFAMYALRGKGYLPTFLASAMEKFDFGISLIAGLAIGGVTYLAMTIFNLIVEFTVRIVIPQILRWKLSESTDVMQIENLTKKVTANEPRSQLASDLSLESFKKLLSAIPDLSDNVGSEQSFYSQLDGELLTLAEEFNEFAKTNNKYRITSIKPFFDQLATSKGKGLNVTLRHMAECPQISDENLKAAFSVTGDLDFAVFEELISTCDLSQSAAAFRTKCLDSAKFWKVSEQIEIDRIDATFKLTERDKILTSTIKSKRKESDDNGAIIQQLMAGQQIAVEGTDESASISEKIESLTKSNSTLEIEIDECAVERRANKAKIDEISEPFNARIIRAHGDKLGLPATATEAEIIIAFLRDGMNNVCDTIKNGGSLLEKKADSVEAFKNKGKHVLMHCQKLLQSDDRIDIAQAHDMLARLAVEAAGFCATGISDVVDELMDSHVESSLDKIIEELPRTDADMQQEVITAKKKIFKELQNQRQELFDMLYNRFMDMFWTRMFLADIDPNDKHIYNSYVNVFEAFNLKKGANAKSDLSLQKVSGKTRLMYSLFAYIGARLMMSLDAAYSPAGIVSYLQSVKSINLTKCCLEWASKFAENVGTLEARRGTEIIKETVYSGEVYDEMEGIIYYGTEDQKRKLLTLMLYDFDVLTTNGELDEVFKSALSAQDAEVESVPSEVLEEDQAQQQGSRWCFSSFNMFGNRTNGFGSQQTPASITTVQTERNQTTRWNIS